MAAAAPATGAPDLRFPLDHPLAWLLALALAHVALRVALSPVVKWDEAEQLLWSQHLAWGYGAQPPLYTWLQWGVNQVFGPGLLALSVLKHGLLVLCYVLMWWAARELLDERGAWWAAASMMLIPTLGWRSLIDLTHTILIIAAACALWLVVLRSVRAPHPWRFALLGVVCALGILAKYSFVVIIAALLLAALSEPTARRALLARGWWWAPLVGTVLVLPHAAWLASHWDMATTLTISKMEIGAQHVPLYGLLRVARGVIGSVMVFALLALAVFRSAWWRRPAGAGAPANDWALRLLWRYLGLIVLALAAIAVLADVTVFKSRWMTPMLCVVPLAAFAARPELQRHPHARRYTLAVVVVALGLLVASGVRPWVKGLSGGADRLGFPQAELAATLEHDGYDRTSPIIASDHMMAGMMRAEFPRAPVVACDDDAPDVAACAAGAARAAAAAGHGWLLVTCGDDAPADWWQEATAALPPAVRTGERGVSLPYHFLPAGKGVLARCNYHWQAPGAGA